MKLSWRRDKGVSPVIATILLVAITVVLTAVLYVIISAYMGSMGSPLLTGALMYQLDHSHPSDGIAVFSLILQRPSEPFLTDVKLTIINDSDEIIDTGAWANWTHIHSSDNKIKSGDRLTLTCPNTDIAGYEVVLHISGYEGTITGRVPR